MLLYDDPDTGLMVEHGSGRGHPSKDCAPNNNSQNDTNINNEGAHQYSCTQEMRAEVNSLRKWLSFSPKSKLVLLLSIASDAMIELVMMFPEVFYGCDWLCQQTEERFLLYGCKVCCRKSIYRKSDFNSIWKVMVFLLFSQLCSRFCTEKRLSKETALA